MAIVLEGDGTITGVTTFTTPLDDIKFDSINVTGIATASTFQAGTGVSISSPRSQTLALFTNNVEGLHLDDAGRVGIGTTNANKAADANNAKVVNAGIITANQYYGNQLTAVGSRVTGVGTFENGLNITGNITNGLNVSAGITTVQVLEATTATFSGTHIDIADSIRHVGDSDAKIRFPAADTVTAETGGSERLRIDSNGDVSIGSATNSGSNRLQIVDSHTEAYVNSTDSIFRIINENTSADTNQASISFTCSTNGSGADSAIVSQAENSSGNSNLQFWTDTSNGMSEKLRIDSSGRLLLGTTTEGSATADDLTVATSGDTGITVRSGTSNSGNLFFSDGTSGNSEFRGYVQYLHSSNALLFGTNAGERARIDSVGNLNIVGVTTVAGGLLQVTSATSPAIQLSDTNNANSDFKIYSPDGDNSLRIYHVNTTSDLLSITSAGRIGIGEVSPDVPLHITGSLPGILLENSGTSSNAGDILGKIEFKHNDSDDAGITAAIKCIAEDNAGNSYLTFNNGDGGNADERIRITSDGKVGINEPSPACILDVEDGASGGDGITEILRLNGSPNSLNDGIKINFARAGSSCGSIVLEKVNNNNTTDLIVSTRASNTVSETVRITGGGKVGIGLTNPESYYSTELVVAASNGGGITIQAANNHVAHLMFADGVSGSDRYAGYVGYNHNTEMLLLRGDGAGGKGLNIESDGDVVLTHGNLKVADTKGIDFSAHGNAGGMTSELLDDYEEGTWTITLHSGGSSISSDNAKYIKVGRMVYFCGECHSLVSSDGNNFEISLPITTIAGAEATFSVMVNSVNMGTAGKWLTGYVFQGQAKARVYQNEDDASWAPISGNDFGNGTMIFGGMLYAAA